MSGLDVHELQQEYTARFPGADAPWICRAPGRVNLIGEHTDYNGLPVLPMAIHKEIRIAFGPRPDAVVDLQDLNPEYPRVTFENGPAVPPSEAGTWGNYCKAAVQGVNEYLNVEQFPGMNLLVSGDLPIAAGLSSSSALVVACGLAYLKVLGEELGEDISRIDLAEAMAEAEHYVGTRGGGMDQATILNGSEGHACKIDFFPLRVEVAPLPAGCAIVVCDSMVKVKKSGAALDRYNAGPRSCALACAIVEKQAREEFGDDLQLERLGDLWYGALCLTYEETKALCGRAVSRPRVTLAEAAKRLQLSPHELRERYLGDHPEPEGGFRLQARLRHLLTEYHRVECARDALLAADPKEFGRLMEASHQSCAEDFRISCPELDALVAAAKEAGALGSRLTGAGFGGATVNLVPEADSSSFIERVGETYYREGRGLEGELPIFVARASEGAGYF